MDHDLVKNILNAALVGMVGLLVGICKRYLDDFMARQKEIREQHEILWEEHEKRHKRNDTLAKEDR